MSESLEFCKKRASNPEVSSFTDRNWNEAVEYDSRPFLSEICEKVDVPIEYTLEGYTKETGYVHYYMKITVDADADFDYFTSKAFLSDGTLLFQFECFEELLKKVMTLGTYNKEMGIPQSGSKVNITIGNFVFLIEYGKFDTENGAWLNERTTVLLPIKMTYEKGIRLGKDEVIT